VCSTVRVSERGDFGGGISLGLVGFRVNEGIDGFRGGNGGLFLPFWGGDSKLMRGVLGLETDADEGPSSNTQSPKSTSESFRSSCGIDSCDLLDGVIDGNLRAVGDNGDSSKFCSSLAVISPCCLLSDFCGSERDSKARIRDCNVVEGMWPGRGEGS
jgi:hypothetical protein